MVAPVNGSHKYVSERRCGTWKLDTLFSALRFAGSWAQRAVFNGVEDAKKLSSMVLENVYAARIVTPRAARRSNRVCKPWYVAFESLEKNRRAAMSGIGRRCWLEPGPGVGILRGTVWSSRVLFEPT